MVFWTSEEPMIQCYSKIVLSKETYVSLGWVSIKNRPIKLVERKFKDIPGILNLIEEMTSYISGSRSSILVFIRHEGVRPGSSRGTMRFHYDISPVSDPLIENVLYTNSLDSTQFVLNTENHGDRDIHPILMNREYNKIFYAPPNTIIKYTNVPHKRPENTYTHNQIIMQDKYLETLNSYLESYLVSCFNKVNTMPGVLASISFAGYTPYWNDGDLCEYDLHINPENLLFTLPSQDLYEASLYELEAQLSLIGENFYKNLKGIPKIIVYSWLIAQTCY